MKPFLLVEDDDDEAALLRLAFRKAHVPNALRVVKSGEDAIDYLSGAGVFADRSVYPEPSLVLLDLKLRGKGGLEVLQWIRSRPEFNLLRVVVLTSSMRTEDLERARELGADSFLSKPMEFEGLVELSASLLRNGMYMDRSAKPGLAATSWEVEG